jgi:hypothetical protein
VRVYARLILTETVHAAMLACGRRIRLTRDLRFT